MIQALSIIMSLAMPPVTMASACYSIRDYDKRLECLARERGSPAGCESIKDWDQRLECRERARRREF